MVFAEVLGHPNIIGTLSELSSMEVDRLKTSMYPSLSIRPRKITQGYGDQDGVRGREEVCRRGWNPLEKFIHLAYTEACKPQAIGENFGRIHLK